MMSHNENKAFKYQNITGTDGLMVKHYQSDDERTAVVSLLDTVGT